MITKSHIRKQNESINLFKSSTYYYLFLNSISGMTFCFIIISFYPQYQSHSCMYQINEMIIYFHSFVQTHQAFSLFSISFIEIINSRRGLKISLHLLKGTAAHIHHAGKAQAFGIITCHFFLVVNETLNLPALSLLSTVCT